MRFLVPANADVMPFADVLGRSGADVDRLVRGPDSQLSGLQNIPQVFSSTAHFKWYCAVTLNAASKPSIPGSAFNYSVFHNTHAIALRKVTDFKTMTETGDIFRLIPRHR
jgi:hypothetical protein